MNHAFKLLLILSLILSACSASSAPTSLEFGEVKTISINELKELPSEGNALKVHDVCYDSSSDIGYAIGIMTDYVAVFNDQGITDYIPLDLPANGYDLKNVFCGDGLAFVAGSNTLLKINSNTLEVTDRIEFNQEVIFQNINLIEEYDLIMVPQDKDSIKVYDTKTMEELSSLALDKTSFFPTKNGIHVFEYLSDQNVNQSYQLDPVSLALTEKTILELPFISTKTAYHEETDTYWISHNDELWSYTPGEKPVDHQYKLEGIKALTFINDQLMILSKNGFDKEDDGNFHGGIALYDIQENSLINEITLPYQHTSYSYNPESGFLYLSNNDGNSVSILDSNNWDKPAVLLSVGNSVEHGAVTSNGDLFVSNRLGGSEVYHFNDQLSEMTTITPNAWPVSMVYNSETNEIYTYDMLDSSISVIDPETDLIVNRLELGLADGASDILAEMILDTSNQKLYIAIPEQNSLTVYDLNEDAVTHSIDLSELMESKKEIAGAGKLTLAIYGPEETLFIRSAVTEQVHIYDAKKDYEEVSQFESKKDEAFTQYPYALYMDNADAELFLGSKIYDAETYEALGTLSYGQQLIAIDEDSKTSITSGLEGNQEYLYLSDQDGSLLSKVELSKGQSINARFTYDSLNKTVYAFYMVTAEIWRIDLISKQNML